MRTGSWEKRPASDDILTGQCLLCKRRVSEFSIWEQKCLARGLCPKCYNSAYRAIKRGLTSWAQMEEHGVALSIGQKRRYRCNDDNAFRVWLAKLGQ